MVKSKSQSAPDKSKDNTDKQSSTATSTPTPPSKPKKQKGGAPPKRNVIYPGDPLPEVRIYKDEDALTCQQARDFLGWQESDDPVEGHVPELHGLFGKYIRMENNNRNRPIMPGWVKSLAQEHLNRQWRFNGESISIGQTGIVLSGQHRFISLLLAESIRQGATTFGGNQAPHWRKLWGDPITMETIVVLGIPEDDDVFKTLNQGKPGTTAHILYRSEYMKRFKAPERKAAARITQYALKLLWERTGAGGVGSFTPRLTPSEAIDFLSRHPKVMEAVETIFIEDKEDKTRGKPAGSITTYISPGYASALLYMMAACETDGEAYRNHDPRGEGTSRKPYILFTMWDKAVEYWVGLCKGKKDDAFQGLRDALGTILGKPGVHVDEIVATLIKGWNRYAVGDSLDEEYLFLQYNGAEELDEMVALDGIDLGDPLQLKKRDKDLSASRTPQTPSKTAHPTTDDQPAEDAEGGDPSLEEGAPSDTDNQEAEDGVREDDGEEVVYTAESAPEGELAEASDEASSETSSPEDNGVYSDPRLEEAMAIPEPEPVQPPPVKRPKRLRR